MGNNEKFIASLTASSEDFLNIVWPQVSQMEMINGGSIKPVEAVAEKNFKDQLDLLAGIDAWQIMSQPSAIRGLASRVQWGEKRNTFTIRTRSKGGGETELEKRVRAIENKDNGHLYPHLTIQAYLNEKKGKLLSAAVIKTEDLITLAAFLKNNMKYNKNYYGTMDNEDGSQFIYIHWDYILNYHKGKSIEIFLK